MADGMRQNMNNSEDNSMTHQGEDMQTGEERNIGVNDDTEDDRKLFIGGVSFELTEKDLKEYFESLGEAVVDCKLKKDPISHRSRGFGFVIFANEDSVTKTLSQPEHKINGKKIDPKKATPRPKKIFVGGVPHEAELEDIQEYFSKFGEVAKIDKKRGFCFVEFKVRSSFISCLKETSHRIKGREVDVKKATAMNNDNSRGGMRGGRGGGRGGYQGQYGGNYGGNSYPYYDNNYYGQGGGSNYDSYYGNNYYQGWQGGAGYNNNQGYNNGYGYK